MYFLREIDFHGVLIIHLLFCEGRVRTKYAKDVLLNKNLTSVFVPNTSAFDPYISLIFAQNRFLNIA